MNGGICQFLFLSVSNFYSLLSFCFNGLMKIHRYFSEDFSEYVHFPQYNAFLNVIFTQCVHSCTHYLAEGLHCKFKRSTYFDYLVQSVSNCLDLNLYSQSSVQFVLTLPHSPESYVLTKAVPRILLADIILPFLLLLCDLLAIGMDKELKRSTHRSENLL